MRVLQKDIMTYHGNAKYWVSKRVWFDLEHDRANLDFEGYATQAYLIDPQIQPLGMVNVSVQGVLDIPNDSENTNAYEVVFNSLLAKVLATPEFTDGTVIELG